MEQEYEKDYSLLRPFDLEAARAGAAICWHSDGEVLNDVTITLKGSVCGTWERPVSTGEFAWGPETAAEKFRMAPLAWVEGKPVYKGCTQFWLGVSFVVEGFNANEQMLFGNGIYAKPEYCTWTPPKVKREGFFILNSMMTKFETFDQADASMKRNYPDFHFVAKCEWEEPAGQEGGAE